MADQGVGYANLVDVGSLALSGSASPVFSVPNGTNKLAVKVACKYAAVAATSGLQVAFQYSTDGSTYHASSVAGGVVAPAAGAVGSAVFEIGVSDLVTRKDPAGVVDYKVVLTNLDATNAVAYTASFASL